MHSLYSGLARVNGRGLASSCPVVISDENTGMSGAGCRVAAENLHLWDRQGELVGVSNA